MATKASIGLGFVSFSQEYASGRTTAKLKYDLHTTGTGAPAVFGGAKRGNRSDSTLSKEFKANFTEDRRSVNWQADRSAIAAVYDNILAISCANTPKIQREMGIGELDYARWKEAYSNPKWRHEGTVVHLDDIAEIGMAEISIEKWLKSETLPQTVYDFCKATLQKALLSTQG